MITQYDDDSKLQSLQVLMRKNHIVIIHLYVWDAKHVNAVSPFSLALPSIITHLDYFITDI